jgi:hypothetical protein
MGAHGLHIEPTRQPMSSSGDVTLVRIAASSARRWWACCAVSVGTLRGLLLSVNNVLVAEHVAYQPDADEGQDYDDVE